MRRRRTLGVVLVQQVVHGLVEGLAVHEHERRAALHAVLHFLDVQTDLHVAVSMPRPPNPLTHIHGDEFSVNYLEVGFVQREVGSKQHLRLLVIQHVVVQQQPERRRVLREHHQVPRLLGHDVLADEVDDRVARHAFRRPGVRRVKGSGASNRW